MEKPIVRKVWALESGFNTENAERDKWFQQNPAFVVNRDKKSKHLKFMPLAVVYAAAHEHDDMLNNMDMWETTSATLAEQSEDGNYKCYETASRTRYHLYQAGEVTLL